MKIRIKENSFIARLAAKKLRSQQVAFTLGNTVHLHNTTRQDFLKDKHWLRHEVEHVKQYKQHGFFLFVIKYLWQSLRKGYHNNPYEVAARNAENDMALLEEVIILR